MACVKPAPATDARPRRDRLKRVFDRWDAAATDGLASGTRAFVEGVFARFRDQFNPKRRSGARVIRTLADAGLFTMRDPRVRVLG